MRARQLHDYAVIRKCLTRRPEVAESWWRRGHMGDLEIGRLVNGILHISSGEVALASLTVTPILSTCTRTSG